MDRILSLNTATLTVDFSDKFLLITWHGIVDFEEYKAVLTKAVEITDVHGIDNVVINRLDLKELNTECRIWMKNYFLKKLVKPIIPKLSKVATIESRSAIGQIYSKTISKTVSLVYPNLTFKSFSSEADAHNWISPITDKDLLELEAVGVTTANSARSYSNLNHPTSPQVQKDVRSHPSQLKQEPQLEQRRNTLLESIYQLFFGSR